MKPVAVLLDEQYQVLEVWVPYYRLKEAGYPAVLLGREKGRTYKSKTGYPAEAEASYADIRPEDTRGVVIPGGFAPDFMRRHPEPARFVRSVCAAGKLTAAICHGGWMLVSAGVLKGRRATCFYAIKDDLVNAGADYVDEEVSVDGNIVTARKPDDLPAFCREMLRFLAAAHE
ncbi:MAG: type 1 glutamine amidotransferase domain-containing protein [Elusimicrobiota bacterium]